MEDAATAEIARVQLWQWVFHHVSLSSSSSSSSSLISLSLIEKMVEEELPGVRKIAGVKEAHVTKAKEYLLEQVGRAERGEWASEFLTSDLMPFLDDGEGKGKL